MNQRGHNENAVRLASLAGDAQIALDKVAQGEADAIEGWLAYGAALNEGRSLFPGDREFGQWKADNVLSQVGNAPLKADEEIAAMWAASNSDQFEEARAAGNARTVRGIHAKWKEIEAEREEARLKEEKHQKAEADRKAAKEHADATQKEAKEKAAAEAEARKAAEAEKDEAAKRIAEERATKATEEREAAEQVAKEAAEAVQASDDEGEEEQPDPHAKLRAEFRKLTDDAKEEDWIGLRLDNAELRARIKKQTGMIADLKAKVKDFDGDQSETIRQLQAKADNAGNQKWKAEEELSAWKRQVHALKKRVAELKRMEIPLN